jgi:hypothetical protein
MVNQRTDPKIYQIKITLCGLRPAIWRRFLAKSDTSLDKLHDIIQYVMGWEDSHLHQFTHKQSYTREAIPALVTETRGQASWFFSNKGVRESGEVP